MITQASSRAKEFSDAIKSWRSDAISLAETRQRGCILQDSDAPFEAGTVHAHAQSLLSRMIHRRGELDIQVIGSLTNREAIEYFVDLATDGWSVGM